MKLRGIRYDTIGLLYSLLVGETLHAFRQKSLVNTVTLHSATPALSWPPAAHMCQIFSQIQRRFKPSRQTVYFNRMTTGFSTFPTPPLTEFLRFTGQNPLEKDSEGL